MLICILRRKKKGEREQKFKILGQGKEEKYLYQDNKEIGSDMKNQKYLPRTALFTDEEQIAENEISEGNS